jgi:L-lactate dehydrogenase complex protein LldG
MQNLIQKFVKNAELTTASVEVVSKKDISESVLKQIADEKNILVSLSEISVLEEFPKSLNIITTPTQHELKNTKITLTDSICGIAETGSIVIDNDKDYASYFTMLTAIHIVILLSKNLYEKPRDIFNKDILKNKTSFSIITGPSATADMGSLVRGVHGPERLHIIIVEDEK